MSSTTLSKREPEQCEPKSQCTLPVTSDSLHLPLCRMLPCATPMHRSLSIRSVGLLVRGKSLRFSAVFNFERKLVLLEYF